MYKLQYIYFQAAEVDGIKYLILHAGRILAEVSVNHEDQLIFCRKSSKLRQLLKMLSHCSNSACRSFESLGKSS